MAEKRCAPDPESWSEIGQTSYRASEPTVFEELANQLQGGPPVAPPDGKKYNILALSGGGKYGAFSAGVLCGWTESGTRPSFDLATGVSTGAIVAVYAFLGSEYDAKLREFYTTVTTRQILNNKWLPIALFTDSLASSAPLKKLIDKAVDKELLEAVATGHRCGRRLLVGTTNLDTKRLVVWDLGAIAASDRADKADLFRKIVLASASVPGEFPPVRIEIEVNGKKYTELHVDGGVTSEVFVRLPHLTLEPGHLSRGPRPLAGSNVYAIIAGKLYANPECVRAKLFGILGKSVSSLVYAMTQNDLLRIYTLSLLTGMKFQFTSLRQDYEDTGDALLFDPIELVALFNEGAKVGRSVEGWRANPPGTNANEQIIPRTGTAFQTHAVTKTP